MAIIADNLDFFGSGAGSESDPNAWLGLAISSVQVTNNSNSNLFANVSGAEASASSVKYRCIYFKNSHGSLTLQSTKLWIETNTLSSDDEIEIGLDLIGLNGIADDIVNEDTAPAPAVTFSPAANKAAGLDLGNVPFGQHFPFWIERTVTMSASAFSANSFILKVEGDTDA